jgi:hypothetical protein
VFPLGCSLSGAIDVHLVDLRCCTRALQAFDFPLQFGDSAPCLIEAADFLKTRAWEILELNLKGSATSMSEFACNMGAMNQAQRLRHAALSKQLFANVERHETDNGYVFTFPNEMSLAALAEWVSLEQKCCPFFDFRIDVPSANRAISLSLTGQSGIKEFIRTELGQ